MFWNIRSMSPNHSTPHARTTQRRFGLERSTKKNVHLDKKSFLLINLRSRRNFHISIISLAKVKILKQPVCFVKKQSQAVYKGHARSDVFYSQGFHHRRNCASVPQPHWKKFKLLWAFFELLMKISKQVVGRHPTGCKKVSHVVATILWWNHLLWPNANWKYLLRNRAYLFQTCTIAS